MVVSAQGKTVTSLRQHFLQKIHCGEWKAGQLIPTEAELMRNYHASRYSIRAALKSLEERGFMHAVPGSGRHVRGDMASRSLRIGLLTRGGDIGEGPGLSLQIAVNSELSSRGHNLLTFTINNERFTLSEQNSGLDIQEAKLDGVIVIARQFKAYDIERLAHCLPTVSLSHDATAVNVPSFFVDFGYNTAVAVTELLKRGHKRIALIDPYKPGKEQSCQEIRRGFELGLHLAGALPDTGVICPLSEGANYAKWLHDEASDVTGVIYYYRVLMEDMYKTAQDKNIMLPDGFETICVSDASINISSPRQQPDFECPNDQMGRDAVDCLIKLISGDKSIKLSNPYFGRFRGFPA